MKPILPLLLLLAASTAATWAADGDRTVLADQGQAKLAIVLPANASERTQATGQTLADYLQRISGAEFTVARDGAGIQLKLAETPPANTYEREAYRLVSTGSGLILEGASELALEHATWDLLYRLGHRQFFPGATWEVIPKSPTLAIAVNAQESPDYASRRIWYGYGPWDYAAEPYRQWCVRNRAVEGIELRTGHAYGALIRSQQAAFDAHPEYYALLKGKRNIDGEAKLCIGNPEVLQVAVAYSKDYFAKNPDAECVSVDPSDGGGWCECELCAKIGSVSDRALLLANTVAEANPGKFVGMYAYSYHSPPPSFDVHPNVIISTATAFIKGGSTVDDLIDGWVAKKAKIGIREYYSVHTWDRDLPGAARGSRLDYLAESIPHFHGKGARFLSAESSDNWGCNGLGYYFAARMLWDVEEAKRKDEIVADFLEKAFGPAQEPMKQFYAVIDGGNEKARLLPSDQLGRMFAALKEARALAKDDPAVLARLDDLALYGHYVHLFHAYQDASGPARQSAFEELIRHGYRMRGTMMIHAKGLYRDLAARDKSVSIPEAAAWTKPEPENPWKSSAPFSKADVDGFVAMGIQQHPLKNLDFEPREFATELVSASKIAPGLTAKSPGSGNQSRGARSWFTQVESAPAEISLNITGGMIAHYRDRGNVKVQAWKIGGPSATGEIETLTAEDASVPPDGQERTVKLKIAEAGTYRIDVDDGRDSTKVTWPDAQPMTWRMTMEDVPNTMFSGRWTLYFYVPEGTPRVGFYLDTQAGSLDGPDGKSLLSLSGQKGEFVSVAVPEDAGGKLWRFSNVAGKAALMNVPPYLALRPEQLLLPIDAGAKPK